MAGRLQGKVAIISGAARGIGAAHVSLFSRNGAAVVATDLREEEGRRVWRRVQRSRGYRWMLVNGQAVLEDGVCTGATPGRLLRGGSGFERASV